MSPPLDVDERSLAAWREASAIMLQGLAGVALTTDALLLLGAQCVVSAGVAMADLAAAVDRVTELALAMRHRVDGEADLREPVKILSFEEDAEP